ncbi:hypothetical protein FOZ60_003514 [Perkinsus olseni]|uniref:Cytochrome P450 n=1 Tax=Perkinsus olseni TaxID=32597 RepID=A0A7J6NV75_PEROL|nr:hypothetical protein FOZ60_003514 [Perkinsus olseni]
MLTITDALLNVVGKVALAARSRPAAGLLTAVAVVYLYRLTKQRKRKAPSLRATFGGPTRFCNSLLGFVPQSLEQAVSTFEILADAYGDAYAMRFMGRDCLILTDGKLIREVFRKRPHSYVRTFNKDKIVRFTGMLTTEGEEWKRNRRLGAPAFNAANAAAMVPGDALVAKRFVRQLQKTARQSDNRIVWEPRKSFVPVVFDCLFICVFGKDFHLVNPDDLSISGESQAITDAMKDLASSTDYILTHAVHSIMTQDCFPWNLHPMIKKFHSGLKLLGKFGEDLAAERRAEKESTSRVDLLSKLLHLGKEDLQGNLLTFFIAGSDSTVLAMSWCLYYLCVYPDVQTRARAEVDLLGHDPETRDDLDNLSFIESCLIESIRLQPALAVLGHEAITEVSVGGKKVAPGTRVIALLRKHLRTSAGGGSLFKPDRWLSPDGSVDRARVRDLLAFGAGPRQCPGTDTSLTTGTVMLATILRHFEDIKHNSNISEVRKKIAVGTSPDNFTISMSPRKISSLPYCDR